VSERVDGSRRPPPAGRRARALRERLEALLRQHPPVERVASDPVAFPRAALAAGAPRPAVEAVALLSAMLAYGAVPLFMRVIRGLLDEAAAAAPREAAGTAFLRAISQPGGPRFSLGYRLSTAAEISRFAGAIGTVISRHGGLWEAFAPGWRRAGTVRAGLITLHEALWQALGTRPAAAPGGLRHLLPDPAGGGCCKRWLMFLRWMVRPDDGVDLGLWPEVPPAALLIPLDRHLSRLARALDLTRRATDDWKTAEEVTAALRQLDPLDPVRYDFALCHLAIAGDCTHGRHPERCAPCPLADVCQPAPPRTRQGKP
jgi:uncharacterized protein (TIGR02757 family)